MLRVGALFSGGKDSTYCIYKAKNEGHQVACLITINPVSDDSLLFHYPNTWVTRMLAQAMQIPLITCTVSSKSKEPELRQLEKSVLKAITFYNIEGLLHGGISSNFQRSSFENITSRYSLEPLAPLWKREPLAYMYELIENNFDFIVTAVSAMGLEARWLGRLIDKESLYDLNSLSEKNKFNVAFEGGEAESLVLGCPLYNNKRLKISRWNVIWQKERGIFEILDALLVPG